MFAYFLYFFIDYILTYPHAESAFRGFREELPQSALVKKYTLGEVLGTGAFAQVNVIQIVKHFLYHFVTFQFLQADPPNGVTPQGEHQEPFRVPSGSMS